MAQYAYYRVNDSAPMYQEKRIGYNNQSYRIVGYNNSLYYLESWQSCSANFPFTYNYLSEDISKPTAKHSYTLISSWKSLQYWTYPVETESGTSYCWDVNWFSTYDDQNHMHVESAFTFVIDGMTYINGSYTKTHKDTALGENYTSTFVVKPYQNDTMNVQTAASSTYSKGYGGGAAQTRIDLKFSQSNKPNNGNITPLSSYYNGFTDNVSGKYTTRYSYNENPSIFVWNTW